MKDFRIEKAKNSQDHWLSVETDDKKEVFKMTKVELNLLKSKIETYLKDLEK